MFVANTLFSFCLMNTFWQLNL